MIWATVSSRSCFCWLYRASPSSTAKSIINLILVLTIWRCPCRVVSCVFGKGCLLWPVCSLDKTLSLCPASFCTPRLNLPVTPSISRLPTFAFSFPMMKRTSFFDVSSRRSCLCWGSPFPYLCCVFNPPQSVHPLLNLPRIPMSLLLPLLLFLFLFLRSCYCFNC